MKKLEEKYDMVTTEDLSSTTGGFVVSASTAIAWGVLGVASYMYGRYLGSKR